MIQRSIYEWDNFFSDGELQQILYIAKNEKYELKNGIYQGHMATNVIPCFLMDMISERLSEKFDFFFYWRELPRFRLAMSGERTYHKNPIHTDIMDSLADRTMMSLVIYLQTPSNESLQFVQSKEYGQFSYSQVPIENIDASRWEVYADIPIKPNKAILFSSSLFHAPSNPEGCGTSFDDGRVILPLFFNVGFNERYHSSPSPRVLAI